MGELSWYDTMIYFVVDGIPMNSCRRASVDGPLEEGRSRGDKYGRFSAFVRNYEESWDATRLKAEFFDSCEYATGFAINLERSVRVSFKTLEEAMQYQSGRDNQWLSGRRLQVSVWQLSWNSTFDPLTYEYVKMRSYSTEKHLGDMIMQDKLPTELVERILSDENYDIGTDFENALRCDGAETITREPELSEGEEADYEPVISDNENEEESVERKSFRRMKRCVDELSQHSKQKAVDRAWMLIRDHLVEFIDKVAVDLSMLVGRVFNRGHYATIGIALKDVCTALESLPDLKLHYLRPELREMMTKVAGLAHTILEGGPRGTTLGQLIDWAMSLCRVFLEWMRAGNVKNSSIAKRTDIILRLMHMLMKCQKDEVVEVAALQFRQIIEMALKTEDRERKIMLKTGRFY